MKMKKAWEILEQVNSGEIQFGDLSEKEQDDTFKAIMKLTKRYVFLHRIWMMRDVIKVIALIFIVLLSVDFIIDLINLFKNL